MSRRQAGSIDVERRFVEETINQKNLPAMDELVAEYFLEHVPFPGQGQEEKG